MTTYGSPATTSRNNGHGDLGPHAGAVLSWKPGSNGNANELLTLDKDKRTAFEFPEVLLKTVLSDSDEALDFAQAIHHCLEFEMWDMLTEIYTILALRPAVDGRARIEFLQGITGVLVNPTTKRNNTTTKKEEHEKGLYNGPPTS